MPRKQSTAAKRARVAQKAAGQKYTVALREARAADGGLARQLRATGHSAAAARLDAHTSWLVEYNRRSAIYTAAWDACNDPPTGTTRRQRHALARARDEALAEFDSWCSGDPYEGERTMLDGAFLLLLHAAAVPDSTGPARAAAAALNRLDCLMAADSIRGMRLELSAVVEGSDTPAAMAARCLAGAAKIPFAGDEEWTACARLLEEAQRWAHAAANPPREVDISGDLTPYRW